MRSELVTYNFPKSRISESFKELRTNLEFSTVNKKIKSILITSCFPEEGKSWTSSNLAVAFAQHNKKVIIVDADLRKGVQGSIFNIPSAPGLSNLLSIIDPDNPKELEDIEFEKYLRKTEIENLSVLSAGVKTSKSSELLSSDAMKILLQILKTKYDYIIFDGTPSILVTDSVALSSIVDATVIIVKHKSTKIDSVKKLKKSITNVGGKIAGVVLNKVPIKSKDYGDNYYYGYYQ